VAGAFGNLVGETGDAHCDRRFVSDPNAQAAPFCQEIIDTVATGQFKDDCNQNHHAAAGDGRCDRANVLGGCKSNKVNEDQSEVWDWYYDVSAIEAEAGPDDGPDGGPTFQDPPLSVDDVKKTCADPGRYPDGTQFQLP
jgi:hypothetical protein